MRVRITATPKESELDGVRLDTFIVGMVHDVSSSIASWLVAQGYAVPEMRLAPRGADARDLAFSGPVFPTPDGSSDD